MTPLENAANPQEQVAYIECIEAQEALYWEARRRGWPLDDKSVGDILRLVAPILATPREPDAARALLSWCPITDDEIDRLWQSIERPLDEIRADEVWYELTSLRESIRRLLTEWEQR